MVSGEPTALRQKDLLGGHHITSCPIQLYHKRSWIPAFINLIFDRNFHYYLIIIQSWKWINQKGEEFCVTSREKKTFNIWTNLILNRYKISCMTQI
jgi:hypothetical protein